MDGKILTSAADSNYCIALEVTNGISALAYKAQEAIWAKEYLEQLTRKPVESGLIYFRNTRPIDQRAAPLDHISQIRGYEHSKALLALERTLKRSLSQRDHQTTKKLYEAVDSGAKLEILCYPENWKRFRKQFPNIVREARTFHNYRERTSQIRGAIVEEYARIIFEELVPEATTILRHKYSREKRTIDIDLVIIGDKQSIKSALTNPRYFIPRFPETNHSI